ncbi:hypothetical protein [Amycolatopsis sp. NPDC001319]|uniref:hypothetical protein n=1 Tax=unclassified Amycolatopsis TaxID=2618356 RepID=UPI0036B42E9E
MVQVITASRPEWIARFTGLESGQFRKPIRLVAKRGGNEIAHGRPGRPWALFLAIVDGACVRAKKRDP